MLANFNWFTHFTYALVTHLNWFKSDHKLVLLNLGNGEDSKKSTRRFRFMASWVTDKSFKDLVKTNWRNDTSWPDAISNLIEKNIEWNSAVFGNINRRKRNIASRLSGIDKANPKGLNQYLNQLQETLWKDYEKILLQEEILWYQRARHK